MSPLKSSEIFGSGVSIREAFHSVPLTNYKVQHFGRNSKEWMTHLTQLKVVHSYVMILIAIVTASPQEMAIQVGQQVIIWAFDVCDKI